MRWQRLHTRADRDALDGLRLRKAAGSPFAEYDVPRAWPGAAADVLVEKIFCRRPLPARTVTVEEEGVPAWLCRRRADDSGFHAPAYETDVRAVLHRVAGAAAYSAWKAGMFDGEDDARVFYDELRWLLLHRVFCPDVSFWARTGLDWAYGLGPPERNSGQEAARVFNGRNALRDIRLFESGLGAEEKAGAVMPVDNNDSPAFTGWKRDAEIDALALDVGRRMTSAALHAIMDACDRDEPGGFSPAANPALDAAAGNARRLGLGEAAIRAAISYARQGYDEIPLPAGADDTPRDSLAPILAVSDSFVESALTGHGFMLRENGEDKRHVSAEKLWLRLAESIWAAGAPQVLFDDAARAGGPFRDVSQSWSGGLVAPPGAKAPSAALDLLRLSRGDGALDIEKTRHAARLAVVALDAAGEDKMVLGPANLAAWLMARGIAYDSDAGRAAAALAMAFISGTAQCASAEMAARAGAFTGWDKTGAAALETVKNRLDIFAGTAWIRRGAGRRRAEISPAACPDQELAEAARNACARAWEEGRGRGFRHAHLTGMDTAPETHALLSGETRDIAPLQGLVRFESHEKVYARRLAPSAVAGLKALGCDAAALDALHVHALGHGTLLDAPFINHDTLRARGLPRAAIDAVERALHTAQHIRYAFNPWILGPELCPALAEGGDGDEDMLTLLGFTREETEAANRWCCGTGGLAGAPGMDAARTAVFACGRDISPDAQIRMQAAIEPFLSGGIAHTLELPQRATIDDVQKLLLRGWELGVKSLRIYRDSSSLLYPAAPAEEEEGEDAQVTHSQKMAG